MRKGRGRGGRGRRKRRKRRKDWFISAYMKL
jgi:hypothetical protein